MPAARILVVDDEPDLVELIELTLGRMGLATRPAYSYKEALAVLSEEPFDLCLTDMRLPDGDGLSLVQWLQEHRAGTPVAVITAHGNVETAVKYLQRAYGMRPDPEIAAHLGEVLWKVGQKDEARKVWRAALTDNPDH
jgi:two-component system response regulator PilR (NtrC family)